MRFQSRCILKWEGCIADRLPSIEYSAPARIFWGKYRQCRDTYPAAHRSRNKGFIGRIISAPVHRKAIAVVPDLHISASALPIPGLSMSGIDTPIMNVVVQHDRSLLRQNILTSESKSWRGLQPKFQKNRHASSTGSVTHVRPSIKPPGFHFWLLFLAAPHKSLPRYGKH
jgi:hypothetical protein